MNILKKTIAEIQLRIVEAKLHALKSGTDSYEEFLKLEQSELSAIISEAEKE